MPLRALGLVGVLAISFGISACASAEPSSGVTDDAIIVAGRGNALTVEELTAELTSVFEGIRFTTESDYPLTVLSAEGERGDVIDAEVLKRAFTGIPATDDDDNGPLGEMTGTTEREFEEWVARDVAIEEWMDDDAIAYAKALGMAAGLMRANLTGLKVVYIAASEKLSETWSDVGLVHIFLTGRAADGTLVAVHTAAVWT